MFTNTDTLPLIHQLNATMTNSSLMQKCSKLHDQVVSAKFQHDHSLSPAVSIGMSRQLELEMALLGIIGQDIEDFALGSRCATLGIQTHLYYPLAARRDCFIEPENPGPAAREDFPDLQDSGSFIGNLEFMHITDAIF